MNNPNKSIRHFMTPVIHTIGDTQPLSTAHEMMRTHHVRHLPVLSGGKLVGLLSQRDLHLVETLPDVDIDRVSVDDAMSQDVYTAGPGDALREVAAAMAERKLGSAVVVEGGKVVGIFTTVDALRALEAVLGGRG